MKENKNKNKIIGISIGILIVLLVVISSTYAYWQITKSQQDPNSIIAACLDFNVDFPVGISKDNAWPISDFEGMQLEGYTFTVTNNCDTDVNYIIGLESVTSDGIGEYLSDASIALAFDNELLGTYSDLTDLQGPSADARGSKELRTATLKGNSTNTHNLKLWIDSSSNVSEQGRGFAGKLFITGGQEIENDNPSKITADACFEMDGNEIIGYDESCGSSVVIPRTINGIVVKTIDSRAFKYVEYNYDYGIIVEGSNPVGAIVYNMDEYDNLIAWANRNGMGALPFYTEEPELTDNQKIQYCEDPVDGSMPLCLDADNLKLTNETVKITGLDLSYATSLEMIEPKAFSNYDNSDTDRRTILEAVNNAQVSLTSLKFGKPEKELVIGMGAFCVIDVDELTMYSNIIAQPYMDDVNYEKNFVWGYFMGANIDNLNIEYVEGYESIGYLKNHVYTQLFMGINADNVNINEGITILENGAFGNIYEGQKINNITLPSTISRLSLGSLDAASNIIFSANSCENVEIDSNAWEESAVVSPNTCVLGQNVN